MMEFKYSRRLNSQYFGALKTGASPRLRVLRGVFLRHWLGR